MDTFEPNEAVVERFWARVQQGEGCWIWTGGRNGEGYGQFMYQRRRTTAHRFAWQCSNGVACPAGRVIRHRCDNPPCVRPDHLEVGSTSQNVRDTYARRRRAAHTWPTGTARHNSQLDDETVAALRRAARSGRSVQSLADEVDVSYSTVLGAIRGARWTHVSEPPVPGRRNRVPNRNNFARNNPGLVADARRLQSRGASLQEIADQLAITKTAAFHCCRTQTKEIAS